MSSFFDLAMCCGGRRKPVEGDKVLDEDLFDRIRKLPDDDDPPSNVSWRNGEPHFNHTLPKSPSLASLRETTPPSTDTGMLCLTFSFAQKCPDLEDIFPFGSILD